MGQKPVPGGSLLLPLPGREEQNPAAECRLRRRALLNRLTQEGMPESYPVFA